MISSFTVKNFKSLRDLTIEPGHFNVLIGANGCGKSNILEALALLAGAMSHRNTPEDLFNRGYRVARPNSTRSAFQDAEPEEAISLRVAFAGEGHPQDEFLLRPDRPDSIAAAWLDQLGRPLDVQRFADYLAQAVARDSIDAKALHYLRTFANTYSSLADFVIYAPNTLALRGLQVVSQRRPVGIHGEGLDLLLAALPEADRETLDRHLGMVDWYGALTIDEGDRLKFDHHKMGRSQSRLYFRDRFMAADNDLLSAENANEGILHLLFHLAVFLSKDTPAVFAVDNLETALNPQLCRLLTASLAELAVARGKQAFVTTHNPAVLDGLNLHDDRQRLFVVSRDGDGHTRVKRLAEKPQLTEGRYKLSELWMRGHLGGLPDAF